MRNSPRHRLLAAAVLLALVAGCGAKTGLLAPCRVDLVPIPPEIIFVLDASGSAMPDPTWDAGVDQAWVWPEIVPGVPAVASMFPATSFGALYFPLGAGPETCAVADHLGVVPRPGAGPELRAYLDTATQAGHSPTAAALAVVIRYVDEHPTARVRTVVLVTDGRANCNAALQCDRCTCPTHNCCLFGPESCEDDVGVPENARQLRSRNVLTAVVGDELAPTAIRDPALTHRMLDEAAAAGGFGRVFEATQGTLAEQLAAVVSIAQRTCQFRLPSNAALTDDSVIAVGDVSVIGDSVNGWSWIDRGAVQLNGRSCERFRRDTARVSIGVPPVACERVGRDAGD